jgi:ubiquinone/menaquinone biosynthesis C-methylase UbiE
VPAIKEQVRRFWDARPCGTGDVAGAAEGSPQFFEALDARRYRLEPFIDEYARFAEQRGRRVLEIGCGAGGDLARFASAGAFATGVDLSPRSLALVRRRFDIAGLPVDLRVADAEALPFPDVTFDLVYSWGVLHHTPDTGRAIAEAFRVLVPGGRACVMLYHRRSLFALQAWLRYALLRGRPSRSVAEVLATHIESVGTKAYTPAEARSIFEASGFKDVTTETVVTVWDARLTRRLFLPPSVRALLPAAWGWFLVIRGRRA